MKNIYNFQKHRKDFIEADKNPIEPLNNKRRKNFIIFGDVKIYLLTYNYDSHSF